MRVSHLLSPSVMGLIGTHGYLCVVRTSQRPLVNVGGSNYYILVIHYHSFGMHINHKPLKLPRIRDLLKYLTFLNILS